MDQSEWRRKICFRIHKINHSWTEKWGFSFFTDRRKNDKAWWIYKKISCIFINVKLCVKFWNLGTSFLIKKNIFSDSPSKSQHYTYIDGPPLPSIESSDHSNNILLCLVYLWCYPYKGSNKDSPANIWHGRWSCSICKLDLTKTTVFHGLWKQKNYKIDYETNKGNWIRFDKRSRK